LPKATSTPRINALMITAPSPSQSPTQAPATTVGVGVGVGGGVKPGTHAQVPALASQCPSKHGASGHTVPGVHGGHSAQAPAHGDALHGCIGVGVGAGIPQSGAHRQPWSMVSAVQRPAAQATPTLSRTLCASQSRAGVYSNGGVMDTSGFGNADFLVSCSLRIWADEMLLQCAPGGKPAVTNGSGPLKRRRPQAPSARWGPWGTHTGPCRSSPPAQLAAGRHRSDAARRRGGGWLRGPRCRRPAVYW